MNLRFCQLIDIRSKTTKSLTGIETQDGKRKNNLQTQVPKPPNPSQGLKLLMKEMTWKSVNVPKPPNPSQGLKQHTTADKFFFFLVPKPPNPSQGLKPMRNTYFSLELPRSKTTKSLTGIETKASTISVVSTSVPKPPNPSQGLKPKMVETLAAVSSFQNHQIPHRD